MKSWLCFAAFSRRGADLARELAAALGGDIWTPRRICCHGAREIRGQLDDWAGEAFTSYRGLVFISACGIAVRAVAPHLEGKGSDPAVVVLDERGKHIISLLSGHIGGANALAKSIARITGGEAVITTATDAAGVTAVDEWAVAHNCAIENPSAVKNVSAAALESLEIGVAVTEELRDAPWPVTLWLRPRSLVLGAGCKKNTSFEKLLGAFNSFVEESGVSRLSVSAVASIDLKREEAGLIKLAESLGVPFVTFSAEELKGVPGHFSASGRVEATTGVDNVCERAAVLRSGGFLLRGKTVYEGITFALAKTRGEI